MKTYDKAKKIIREKGICRNVVESKIFIDMLINWEYLPKEEIERMVEENRKKY